MSVFVEVAGSLPETGTALVGLAQVKAYLGIDADDATANDLLSDLITRASSAVQSYLSHEVLSHSVTEQRNGTGSRAMMTTQWPVSAVQSVSIDGLSIPAAAGVGQPGYRFTATAIIVEGYRFTRGLANVELAYTAGWAEVPADIAQAVIETVGLMYRRRDHLDVSSKSLAGETVSFITAELTPSAKQTLENYRHRLPTP